MGIPALLFFLTAVYGMFRNWMDGDFDSKSLLGGVFFLCLAWALAAMVIHVWI